MNARSGSFLLWARGAGCLLDMARGLLLLLVGTAQLLLKAGSQRLLEYNATLGGAAMADELPCLIANTDEAADLYGLILSSAELQPLLCCLEPMLEAAMVYGCELAYGQASSRDHM